MAGKREKPARAGAGAKQQAEPKAQKAPKDPKKPKGLKEPKEPKEPKAPKAPVATGDFPRGGATGLTPLEFREVARRAENEVLFSDGVTDGQAGKKRRPQDAEDGPKTRKKKTKAAKAGTAVEATASNNDDDDERASPVESLSLKRLTEGALVLGCVAAIRDLELSVSLPNGLVGTVPITSISPELTALVEKAAEAAADSDDDDDDAMDVDGGDKDDPLDLHRRFFVGQFVKCAVASVTDGKSAAAGKKGKPRPRLELTLMPEEINRRIDPDDLCEGMVLSASVRSVEDRGYVLNTGLPGEKVAAFLPTGAAQAWIDRWMPHAAELRPGQLVEAAVVSVSSDRRALRLTIDPAAVSQAEVKEPFKTMASAQPGHLVSATVVKTWDRGLSLRFMGFYDCSADLTNIDMPAARDQTEVEARYSPGDA
ncbi:rRNA biogenesis protein rrp5, partial [Coemansia nantahalensis]